MKKIFAFVLATIMVMSLVPASVFAAFTKPCETIHTTDNCSSYAEVKNVAPTCTTTGYTLYVCNICGVQFTDNVKAKVDHNYVTDTSASKNDLEASCLYQTPGKTHKKCSVCNAPKVDEVKWNSITVHNLVKVSGMGCEELFQCTICGAQGYKKNGELSDTASHTLKYKRLLEEPSRVNGVEDLGLALFECDNSGCAYEKEIEIRVPACSCETKTLIKAQATETCAAAGTYAVYKCDACAKLWYDSDKNTAADKVSYVALADRADDNDEIITVDDAIIPAKAHTEPSTGVTQSGCTKIYTCTACNQTIILENHLNVREDVMPPIAAGCATYGVKYKVCTACGNSWPELTNPTGHLEATITVESNCAVKGGVYTYCTRGDACSITTWTIIGGAQYKLVKQQELPLDKTKHNIQYIGGTDANSGKPSCTTSGLVITTCANGCAEYLAPVVEYKPATQHDMKPYTTYHNCSVGSSTMATWTSRTFYYCVNCDLNTKDDYKELGYTKEYYVDIRDTAIRSEFNSLEEAKEYHGLVYRTWKLVDGELVVVKTSNRGYMDHTLEEQTDKVKATSCKERGYKVYKCTGCQQTLKVWSDAPVPEHTDNTGTAGTPATCNTSGKYTVYKCTVCNDQYYYNVKGEQVEYTGSNAPTINPCGSTLEIKTACGGKEYYRCKVCNTYYDSEACTNTVAPSVMNHTWNTIAGAAATCNKDGALEVRYCTLCAKTEVNVLYVYGGNTVRVALAPDTANYKTADVVVNVTDDHYLAKDVTVTVDEDGVVTYTCETVTTSICPVAVKKLNHTKYTDWTDAIVKDTDDVKAADNHTAAIFNRYACAGCDYEYISDFVGAKPGHQNSKGSILTTDCSNEGVTGNRICVWCVANGKTDTQATITVAHTPSATTSSTMDCQKDGYTYSYCTKCGFGAPVISEVSNATTYHNRLKDNYLTALAAGTIYTNNPPSDYAHNGAFNYHCTLCNAKVKDGASASNISAGLEIYANVNSTKVIPGATVKVDITLESLKGVDVWALAFPVKYNAEFFQYVGAEWNSDSEFAVGLQSVTKVPGGYTMADDNFGVLVDAEDKNDPTTYDYDYIAISNGQTSESGVLHIVANANAGVQVKAEQLLVTLEFKVISSKTPTEPLTFDIKKNESVNTYTLGQKLSEKYKDVINPITGESYDKDTTFAKYYEVTGRQTKYITMEVLSSEGVTVPTLYAPSGEVAINMSEAVTLESFLDFDGYGISLTDAYALYALIYNGEYDVRADANFDSRVDGVDLKILYAVYTGIITIDQLIAPNAELPEGFQAWMGQK